MQLVPLGFRQALAGLLDVAEEVVRIVKSTTTPSFGAGSSGDVVLGLIGSETEIAWTTLKSLQRALASLDDVPAESRALVEIRPIGAFKRLKHLDGSLGLKRDLRQPRMQHVIIDEIGILEFSLYNAGDGGHDSATASNTLEINLGSASRRLRSVPLNPPGQPQLSISCDAVFQLRQVTEPVMAEFFRRAVSVSRFAHSFPSSGTVDDADVPLQLGASWPEQMTALSREQLKNLCTDAYDELVRSNKADAYGPAAVTAALALVDELPPPLQQS
ncbi:hypothetical protein B0T26DRAFT_681632 [Lasiosphaeria miniovina]|uniref:Uncharacterized protein n=1 Tax=Lasiosphaeria miniovina TaxID=1954250 RepID=A0AA39ZUU8_9PEZI|nr:uncharacterized protein B0T26DRAFT_681632 [Lasiosphaeria miniovina]KAK0704018.1 hypothetical protein B0T26DRAFT_681632 [Lasiosphaeria miniovina]